MGDWIAFWDSKHSIYVNARHRDVHYRTIAEHIRAYLPPDATVLDYGCGEALSADLVAGAARRMILCDAAPTVRAGLAARYAGRPSIEVRSPDEVAGLPSGSLDVVVMHSVAQYLIPAELDARLALFRRLLRADGLLILGDIIPPDVSAATDAMALLRFAGANGFFIAAMFGLVRTVALTDYMRLRTNLGLTRYSEADIVARLEAAEFSAQRAPDNIGHNPARMTFLAQPEG
jgi:SAM-dependent methyltransferase